MTDDKDQPETNKEIDIDNFKKLIDNSPVGVFSSTVDGRLLYANNSLIALMEGDATMIPSIKMNDLYKNESDRTKLIQALMENGRIDNFEVDLVTSKGNTINICLNATIANNTITGMVFDLTESRQLTDMIKKSEEDLRSLIDSSQDCICHISLDGKILSMNPAGRIYNNIASNAELKDLDAVGNIVAGRQDAIDSIKKASMGEVVGLRYQAKYSDGKFLWWDSKLVPVKDALGNITSILRISRDISEQISAEEELQRTKKFESLGHLAGGMAHDFNNILTVILGNIELTKSYLEYGQTEESIRALNLADKAVYKAKNLTQKLLNLSRGGLPVLKPQMISDLIQILLSGKQFAGTKIDVRIDPEIKLLRIDENQISLALGSLLSNAIYAIGENGTVRIEVEKTKAEDILLLGLRGDIACIKIIDDGCGIDPSDVIKIFDPYFSTKNGHSGLGLPTAYTIIRRHGGDLRITSEKGKGTTASVYLQIADPLTVDKKETLSSTESLVTPKKTTNTILVMDDEENIRIVVCDMLEQLGYETETAQDGQEAIDLYRDALQNDKCYLAAILDIIVPGSLGGIEAIKEIKIIDPEVKAMAMTGFTDMPIQSDHKYYGFKAVLNKPFGMDELGKKIKEFLA